MCFIRQYQERDQGAKKCQAIYTPSTDQTQQNPTTHSGICQHAFPATVL